MGGVGGGTFEAISHISKFVLQFLRKLKVLDYFMEDPLAIFEIFKNYEGFGICTGRWGVSEEVLSGSPVCRSIYLLYASIPVFGAIQSSKYSQSHSIP